MMRNRNADVVHLVWFWCVLAWACPVQAAVTLLYDVNSTLLPGEQEWLFYSAMGEGMSQQRVVNGVRLDSTLAGQTGYSSHTLLLQPKNSQFPNLNRQKGFSLSFALEVRSEHHVSNDRAGCCLILLDQESRGVELDFWENEIWAQGDEPLFSHGEKVVVNTRQYRRYLLRIKGDRYALFTDGTLLLSGPLKEYSAFGPPYNLGSYLFFGDNSSRGQASIVLGEIVLKDSLFSWNLLAPLLHHTNGS